ncbi:transposase [Neomoorella humiferrea]|uniref:Transposase DDE domain protein n=1 Tax=Neomoorella humiferrea TaxID=676965 RepID=A0A2T0AQK4_9FIRM|nr:transposase [Moorella humiferrea]PRR71578.1 Transposase DDE domain protein [Moorella humiferrea]
MPKHKQISLCDLYEEFEQASSKDKLKMLTDYVDIEEIIPLEVKLAYYKSTGRPPYSLASMLSALILQKILSIPTVELLVTFLELSEPLRDFCGFTQSVPDPATFSRFKDKIGPKELKKILDRLVELTEPYLKKLDPFAASLLVLDTTGLEVPVRENNPKFFYSLKNQVEKGAPEKPENEIYAMTIAKMPKCARAAPKAKLMYTNGHFAYAYTAAILTNGFGLVRNVMLFEGQKDSLLVKPVLEDFRQHHDLSRYEFFAGDAGFDSTENFRYLVQDCNLKPVINLNPRNTKELPEPRLAPEGVPVCPKNPSLKFKYAGFCKSRNRIKWLCPLSKPGKKGYTCTCQDPCTPSKSGRMVYTYPQDNYRKNTPVPRNSELWKKIYLLRIAVEQAISRLKLPLMLGRLTVTDFASASCDLVLAAIAQNLVALIALRAKLNDKVRSIRWLVA